MRGGIRKAFKTDLIKDRSLFLHPLAFMFLAEMIAWAHARVIKVSVTETVTTPEEDKALSRVSSSHSEGRAFDISTKGWGDKDISDFIEVFSEKYASIAAKNKEGKPVLIVRHDTGRGDHFHVQISKSFSVVDFKAGERLV